MYLPQWGNGGMWGTYAAEYSAEWQIGVRGEKEAKSFVDEQNGRTKNGLYKNPGTYKEAPPIAAYREWQGGRLATYSCAHASDVLHVIPKIPCIMSLPATGKRDPVTDTAFFQHHPVSGKKALANPTWAAIRATFAFHDLPAAYG